MAQELDIFNPQVSVIANGLAGKVIMLYGGNNVGKTYQAVRAEKPYVLRCENGLNGQAGVKFGAITDWAGFKKVVKQFTGKSTVERAKEMYSTIIIDEVYASAMFCQDFICSTYGNGAIDLGDDTGNTKLNLYRLYEKEYWRQINLLTNSGYTVIFIAHAAPDNTGFISPKGDAKRCLAPIIDNCDVVAYIKANGVDEDGKVIKSSAYFAQTNEFFARSRYDYMVTSIEEFTIEGLTKAITDGIEAEAKALGYATVSYDEQKANNTVAKKTYDELMEEMQKLGATLAEADRIEELTEIVENNLGKGRKASDLKKGQEQAIELIISDLYDFIEENGLTIVEE